MYIYSRAFSSSSFTNSFLAESSTVSERGDGSPNGGRAVRRHDDGDGNERRRCCGHSEHAARTFGALVAEENEGEKERAKGEERRIKGGERGRREKEERPETTIGETRTVQAITYIQRCSRHMHARPLGSYHSTRRTYMYFYVRAKNASLLCARACVYVCTCDAYTHRTCVRLHREREMGARRTRTETPPTSDSMRLKRLTDIPRRIFESITPDSAGGAAPPAPDSAKLYGILRVAFSSIEFH